jgi:putative ABC transport system permease protein
MTIFVIQVLSVLNEGLIFGFVALGIYVSFQWLRFPDLTPDGAFAIGGAVYVEAIGNAAPQLAAVAAAALFGALAGCVTAGINRWGRVPSVVAGLLTSSGLYSVAWLLLGRPNRFIARSHTMVGDLSGATGAFGLLIIVFISIGFVVTLLSFFSGSLWGLRLQAIGENPYLARDLATSETSYTFLGLGIANGCVGIGGALFVQRSFSADINMGLGITIIGLAGMILGLVFVGRSRRPVLALISVVLGAVAYKALTFGALVLGAPAEAFRLVSALVVLFTFALLPNAAERLLTGLRWS